MTAIYGILDTESDTFVSYNSKCGWSKAGNAKNAFNLHTGAMGYYNPPKPKFDEQTRYKLVELTGAYFRLEGLEMNTVQVTKEEYSYLKKRDAQLEFALDMIPNLDDVLEQFVYEEDAE